MSDISNFENKNIWINILCRFFFCLTVESQDKYMNMLKNESIIVWKSDWINPAKIFIHYSMTYTLILCEKNKNKNIIDQLAVWCWALASLRIKIFESISQDKYKSSQNNHSLWHDLRFNSWEKNKKKTKHYSQLAEWCRALASSKIRIFESTYLAASLSAWLRRIKINTWAYWWTEPVNGTIRRNQFKLWIFYGLLTCPSLFSPYMYQRKNYNCYWLSRLVNQQNDGEWKPFTHEATLTYR